MDDARLPQPVTPGFLSRRKALTAGGGALGVGSLLAACGSDDDAGTTPASPVAPPPGTAPVAPVSPTFTPAGGLVFSAPSGETDAARTLTLTNQGEAAVMLSGGPAWRQKPGFARDLS